MIRSLRLLACAAAALALQGCFASRYVAQAARGELAMLAAARRVPEVVAERATTARVGRLLLSVDAVKRFGRAHGLSPTLSYERYADLHRAAAVWVVQGSAPLAFDVRRWHLPLVGTIPYLGFFDRDEAQRYGAALARDEGLDVEVRGASAYSTLGWFHDPVLSTMIGGGEDGLGELANVVLHESVHATLYVKNQSAFDESLASFVADRLTPVWLAGAVGPDAPETRAWIAAQAAERVRVERLHRAYLDLDAVYRSDESDAVKRAEKARLLGDVRDELGLTRPLNNAALAGYVTYDSGGPAFERLLGACGGNWRRFMGALATLGEQDFEREQLQDFDAAVARAAGACAAPGARAASAP